MVSKRRAADSDSENEGGQPHLPPPKRPRTSQPGGTQRDEEPMLDPELESKFEKEHEDAVMQQLLGKQQNASVGGIAEMGIIEKVEMVDFMCHRYLEFKFGPQVNFIIGHNGSGKSAVLSAITVALGGKATTTGRGAGLKSFVREGQQVSEVTIVLKNQGEEAYKPKVYGKSIIITRRFTKDGSSSYKIKNKDDRLISNKREELSAICDHMNIQVDNPMNILTQDAARQFLSASHASDKYRFFLKGTQLSQLSDEYETCMENIVQTDKILSRKKEALPDLHQAWQSARRRFQEASKAVEQKQKVDELKKELAWTHVADKEKEMKEKFGDVAKARNRLPKIQEKLDEAKMEFDDWTEKVVQLEQQHNNLGDVQDLHDKRKDLQAKINTNKDSIRGFQDDMKRIDQDIASSKTNISRLTTQIDEEALRMETHTNEKRELARQKLDQAKADWDAKDAEVKRLEAEQRNSGEEASKTEQEGRGLDDELRQAQAEVENCRQQVINCDNQAKSSLSPYGNNIAEVIEQTKRLNWHGQVPVGPLGIYVKLRDPKWAPTMRIQLGNLMTSWAITDARDRKQLKNLLDKSKNTNVSIVISEVDLFDYSRGEPNPQYLTPLRVLEFSNQYVLRIFINQSRIESTYLTPLRSDADELLGRIGGSGSAWSGDFYNVIRYAEGGGTSRPMNTNRVNQQLFSGDNLAAAKSQWQERLAAAQDRHQDIKKRRDALRRTYDAAMARRTKAGTQARIVHSESMRLRAIHDQLQIEANEELPAGIAGLQEMKDSEESELASLKRQFDEILSRKAEVDLLQQPLIAESSNLRRLVDSFEERKRDSQKEIEDAVTHRAQSQSDMDHYTKKLSEENAKIEDLEAIAKITEEEFTNWTATALDICPRVPANRSVDAVKRNLDSVNKALKEREKKQGASVEEITQEVTRTRAAYESTKEDITTMLALNKNLNNAVKVRLARWHDFRRHIALRCKVFFQYNLSNRGYFGKVLFDHGQQTLQLRVQTENTGGQEAREKDPKALSGGEKSFSTICLLLALWESIGCPIRCLDEFDVFMDAVNRRVSMKMMIATAKASDGKQYVLITPQDMGGAVLEEHVRCHKMSDPERNQGILRMN